MLKGRLIQYDNAERACGSYLNETDEKVEARYLSITHILATILEDRKF